MKMRLEGTFIRSILLCLFIYICNGAPHGDCNGEVGVGKSSGSHRFTEEEDKFIVDAVSSLVDVMYTQNTWNKITKDHREKWKAGTSGFPQERSTASLRCRFWNVLMKNHPRTNVKVPEILKNKIEANSKRIQEGPENYNQKENDLIFEELLKTPCTQMFAKSTLEAIRKAHESKRRANIDGFHNERSLRSIEWHLFKLKRKDQIPREVLEKFPVQKGHEPFNQKEDDLIVEELRKASRTKMCSLPTLEAIRSAHERKRQAEIDGFESERTVRSIEAHLFKMRRKGQIPSDVLEKFPSFQKVTGSKESTVQNPPLDYQETSEEQDDDEWVARILAHPFDDGMIEDFENKSDVYKSGDRWSRFSEEEDNFLIQELKSLSDNLPVNEQGKTFWKKIAENHRKKYSDGTSGFLKERSVVSLYNRSRYHLMPNLQLNNVNVPENLKGKSLNPEFGKIGTGSRPWYSPEEDFFIVEELLKPSVDHIFSTSTLESLCAKHDIKREAKIPGFEYARTSRSLRARINTLKKNGLLPKGITAKLVPRPTGANSGEPSSSSTHQGQQTTAETDEMINELINNTDYEFDFSDFV